MAFYDGMREAEMNTPMAKADGSMTFDWIFFAIVAIPMIFAAWELYKSYSVSGQGRPRYLDK